MAGEIHLGYEVGSGGPVAIPLRHMAVTGQTQQSGKTTTLEALIQRSGVTSLTFVTKRGEKSFTGGRRIQPYFRNRADWQFVTSIIDATLQEKNKFLRPWIIKTCRTTKTLADVQVLVREALESAKGISHGVYTQLDAYLELIVPEIERAELADTLDLQPGLNVMDVSDFATPMQMLFIQSALDWVNERCTQTTVVIPEAWEFLPQSKGSPVKASAETLIRKGAGIGNHIWLDSQDMAGVDNLALRACTVWLIGVQREANEVKRALANIPANLQRPSAADVATLERGQFFACFGKTVTKVYVQPAWMPDHEAEMIARGQIAVEQASRPVPIPQPEEEIMSAAVEKKLDDLVEKIDGLTDVIGQFVRSGIETQRAVDEAAASVRPVKVPIVESTSAAIHPADEEALYQRFKARLSKEAPAILKVLVNVPEIRVEHEIETIEVDGKTPRGRIARLIADGFFDEPKTSGNLRSEMARTGADGGPNLTRDHLGPLTVMGFLTRSGEGFKAVAVMKKNIKRA